MLRFPQQDALEPCLTILRDAPDTVFLAPTETVYGLLCDYDSTAGREKIYELKDRPKSKLLAAFFPSVESVRERGYRIPKAAELIADRFCPGPVTLVIPDGSGGTFGFRIPDHPFVLDLLKKSGRPLASTSANLSGTPAALSVREALATLTAEPDVVIDGGAINPASKASTVIQVSENNDWKILRPGPVSEEEIRQTLNALKQ